MTEEIAKRIEEYKEFLDIVRERYLKRSKKMRSIKYGKHRTL